MPFREGGLGLRCEIGTSGLLGILGRLSVSGVCTSTTRVCSAPGRTGGTSFESPLRAGRKPRTQPRCWPVKAWRCQSGPESLSPISARRKQSIQRWESGLTVGNFTHQLLATPFLQPACTCHRCPQTTKLCWHRNEVLVLRATSAVCLLVRRPHFRLRSPARCSWSVCICPSTWTHDSASAANCWTCMVTTDQHVHGSVS